MFLHFNMGTFTGQEWASPNQNPNLFNPTALDCNQWATAAAAGGMKYAVLVTKHHDGFSLWPTAYSKYSVASSSWKNGKGDVVREFVDAMRAKGLKVGFYFSIWDKTNGDANGIPSMTFVQNQLRELLTNYGPISIIWFDGWGWWNRTSGDGVPYGSIPYKPIHDFIKSLQPNVIVAVNDHLRSFNTTEIFEYEKALDGVPPASNTNPSEVVDTVRSSGNWFFSGTGCDLNTQSSLQSTVTSVEAGHANYLLDFTPDKTGLLPSCQVNLLAKLHP
jgi:alpha-L-fucosidase